MTWLMPKEMNQPSRDFHTKKIAAISLSLARQAATAPSHPVDIRVLISQEARRKMIETAAYFRAEKRNFAAGYDEQDWLEAETEIDMVLSGLSKRSE